jgi:DedD protein
MVKQIITDEESKLKRQARRRLIGAIALTILVVVLLPMVLDREPPAPTQEIELQIPDKNKAGEFVPNMVLPPTLDAASQPSSAPVIAPLLNGPSPVVTTKPVIETSSPIVAKPDVANKVVNEDNPRKKPEPKPKGAEVKQAAKTIVKPHSGFVVQVGAFSHADTANALREKLHKQGYPSYTEKSGGVIRVRIGGYNTQTEAEKIRHKLEKQGMKPDVVNLN